MILKDKQKKQHVLCCVYLIIVILKDDWSFIQQIIQFPVPFYVSLKVPLMAPHLLCDIQRYFPTTTTTTTTR